MLISLLNFLFFFRMFLLETPTEPLPNSLHQCPHLVTIICAKMSELNIFRIMTYTIDTKFRLSVTVTIFFLLSTTLLYHKNRAQYLNGKYLCTYTPNNNHNSHNTFSLWLVFTRDSCIYMARSLYEIYMSNGVILII